MTEESKGDLSPARRGVAVVCAIIAGICSIAAAVIETDVEPSSGDAYEQCLDEQRSRIAREGSLLRPEDFCDIYPGR
ncbi:hypothetical protein EV193_102799 [Herbihabitans rhizosphaerae]|uniref:Uncharacterized protein n=1 Tax=Herbihabitans rhizosphaerae TaxID=1872711 RepID=A0A4Q7L2N4_9PSEU|nr:hypothetical protein [Herbihabitans rhizosphaerae]RZS43818.1 hypothetical protein EV193_102799 [Herbihabitans rhizosphaerae]